MEEAERDERDLPGSCAREWQSWNSHSVWILGFLFSQKVSLDPGMHFRGLFFQGPGIPPVLARSLFLSFFFWHSNACDTSIHIRVLVPDLAALLFIQLPASVPGKAAADAASAWASHTYGRFQWLS